MDNIYIGSILIVVLIFTYFLTFSFPSVGGIFADPALYPRIIIFILMLLSGVTLFNGLKEMKNKKHTGEEIIEKGKKTNLKKPIEVLFCLIIYFSSLNYFNLIIPTFIFLIIIFMIYGGKFRIGLIYAIFLAFSLYVLFEIIFKIPFFPKYKIF